jgi:hypothetical protein
MCESFFATLECELINRRRFRSHSEARIAVFQFIEGFYNPSRRHSALGYLSPIEYDPLVGLAQRNAGFLGQPHQPLARPMHQLGVGRKGDRLGLHSGVDNDLGEICGLGCARSRRNRQAFLDQRPCRKLSAFRGEPMVRQYTVVSPR